MLLRCWYKEKGIIYCECFSWCPEYTSGNLNQLGDANIAEHFLKDFFGNIFISTPRMITTLHMLFFINK